MFRGLVVLAHSWGRAKRAGGEDYGDGKKLQKWHDLWRDKANAVG